MANEVRMRSRGISTRNLQRAMARLLRLRRDQKGQAIVETMLLMMFMAFFLLVAVQLFFISDLASYVLVGVHKKITKEIHEYDDRKKFKLFYKAEVTKSLPALPGLDRALEYFGKEGVPGEYSITRRLAVSGGSFKGKGESLFWSAGFLYFPWETWMAGNGSRIPKMVAGMADVGELFE